MQYLTIPQIALDLGIPRRTVQNYAKEGFLPAITRFHEGLNRYVVEFNTYHTWKIEKFSGVKKGNISKYTLTNKELSLEELKEEAQSWLDWCKTGKLTGKPLAERTVEIYDIYFKLYLSRLKKYPTKPIISVNNLRDVLGSFRPEQFSTKRNVYDAIMSFSKYLIEKELQEVAVRVKMKELKPRRFIPAKKTSLTEAQLAKLYASINDSKVSAYAKLLNKVIVCFLVNTGLRASEFCNLKLVDVNLEEKRIYVWLGKGNKNRIVGISNDLYEILLEYLKLRLSINSNYDNFFLSNIKAPFNVAALGKKITRLTAKAGLKDLSPHSFRRSFVTINAAKGKPLNHLRIACGHADISTTQSYCMTSVDEVVEAMRGW
ncbi:MAG: tyrosine-type recombinase/integrase [Candidatus Melainabacteria bacterium]|nr:tyrosine-type recombinase/integrase [Candidatus Melainabacteria bacterium]